MGSTHLAASLLLLQVCFLEPSWGIGAVSKQTPTSRPSDTGGVPHHGNENENNVFNCTGRKEGYYGDKQFECIMFHYCSNVQKRYSYKCRDGKKFDELTSSCTYYLGTECRSSVSAHAATSTSEDKQARGLKFSFPTFPHEEMRNEISRALSSSEGIGALSAFASLSQSIKPTKFPDSSTSESERNFEFRERSPQPEYREFSKLHNSESLSQNYEKRVVPQEQRPPISRSDNNDYHNTYTDQNTAANHFSHDRSFYTPPVYHAKGNFDNFQESAHIPHFDVSRSHASPTLSRSISNHPTSHINFTPPGSSITSKHTISHSNDASSFQNFQTPSHAKSIKRPPSIFATPSPTILSSTPRFGDFLRSPAQNGDIHTPQFYDDLTPFNPYSTPAYYDYDLPFYQSPIPLPVNPYNPYDSSISLAGYPHHRVELNVPINHAVNNPNYQSSFVNHPTFSSPDYFEEIPRSHGIKKSPHQNIIRTTTEKSVRPVKKSRPQRPFVTNNPILHVTKFSQSTPRTEHQFREDNIYDTVDFHNQNHGVEVVSPDYDYGEVDVTTYAPSTTPKLVSGVLKPKVASPLNIKRRLTSRRRKPSSLINKPRPKVEIVRKTSTVSPPSDNEEAIGIFPQTQKNEINLHDVTSTVKPLTRNTPKSPLLRGGLKERLNRLGTRRTLNQGNRRQTNNKPRTVTPRPPNLASKPLKKSASPFSIKTTEVPVVNVGIPLESKKKLKNRISNFFKDRSSPINSQRNRKPVRTRVTAAPKTKKKEIVTEEKIARDDLDMAEKEEDLDYQEVDEESPKVIEINQAVTVTTTKPAVSKTSVTRKRPMTPDVRARFKDFLKKRKNGLNERKRLRSPQKEEKLKKETDNVVQIQKDSQAEPTSLDESKDKSTAVVEAISITPMEKSVPLFRTEAVVKLDNMEPVDVQETAESKTKFTVTTLDSQGSYSHPVVTFASAKPFRYMINRRKVVNDLRLQQQRQRRKEASKAIKPLDVQPSITNHRVVRPSNFKQIVKMSPRNPVIPDQNSKAASDQQIQNHENKKNKLSTDPTYILPTTNSPKSNRQFRRDPKLQDRSHYSSVTPSYKNLAIDFHVRENSDDLDPPQHHHKEKSRPVFNLDIVEKKDEVPHLSALEATVDKNVPSEVHFEPFSIDNEEPMLPIEKLLSIT